MYLDVRPALEYEEAGKVPGSVNVPVMNSKRRWDAKEQKKVQLLLSCTNESLHAEIMMKDIFPCMDVVWCAICYGAS